MSSMETSILSPEHGGLSPPSCGRRSSASNSPEFEFWMIRNPSSPPRNLLSADELFVDGVLLPLHLLHLHPNCESPDRTPQPQPEPPNSKPPTTDPLPETSPAITESATAVSASKRWKGIFKKGEQKTRVTRNITLHRDREKEKKTERKSGHGGSSGAELNINIWPFSRSRSAGNGGSGPKLFSGALGTRKVSSAPCSRSNSAGESKSRKWPSSPNRPGVHIGRSSPVWQVKRSGSSGMKSNSESLTKNAVKGFGKEFSAGRRSKTATKSRGAVAAGNNGKAKVLNLNVPTCIGNRHHLSCRSDVSSTFSVVGGGGGTDGGCRGNGGGGFDSGESTSVGNNNSNLFNLRNLFTKKSVMASH